jgi:hypothetical protein
MQREGTQLESDLRSTHPLYGIMLSDLRRSVEAGVNPVENGFDGLALSARSLKGFCGRALSKSVRRVALCVGPPL